MKRHAALFALGSAFSLLCLWGGAAAVGPASPTRADLDRLRRRVALLESEHALALSRKPYVILDLGARTLRYGLLGMTLRELNLGSAQAWGLETAEGIAPAPTAVAGILTLKEKERDPRLSPLTPAQIEAGATDEDAADVLPPEAPEDYLLLFKQPLHLQVEGSPKEKRLAGAFSSVGAWWRRLWGSGAGHGGGGARARITVHLDEATAREVYRSLVPGERLVVVPPPGLLLPEAGQEPARSIRPAKPATPPIAPPEGPPGIPFRIPPPVETSAEPATAGEGTPVEGERAPEPSSQEDAPPEEGAPPEETAPPSGEDDAPEEPPEPEDQP